LVKGGDKKGAIKPHLFIYFFRISRKSSLLNTSVSFSTKSKSCNTLQIARIEAKREKSVDARKSFENASTEIGSFKFADFAMRKKFSSSHLQASSDALAIF
jgi:hypothetical protein